MPDSNNNAVSRKPDYSGIKVAAVSLGCSKNRIDTEELLGLFKKWGCLLTENYAEADLVFVNTCGFIEDAQQESVNTLLNLTELKQERKPILIAAGCLVEVFGSKIIRAMPDIDGAIGVHSYQHLNRFMKMLFKGQRNVIRSKPSTCYSSLAPRILTSPVHSANVKIAEGCSNRCSYCLIPNIRGSYRSRAPEEIMSEIKSLLKNGAREISLIAQDTTAYGSDREELPDLSGLIKQILTLKDKFWLRIMYTYPSRITDELIELIAAEPRICKYLDIPIQHTENPVLKQMGRKYNKTDLETLFDKLRRRIPGLSLRTTCMVGFPGEGKRQFKALLRFIAERPFENLGAFTYSEMEGTAACGLLRPVPKRVANKRHRALMLAQQGIVTRLNKKITGKKLDVLIDKVLRPGSCWYYGRTEYQAPEVDGGVYLRSDKPLQPGDLVTAKIRAASPYDLLAFPVKKVF